MSNQPLHKFKTPPFHSHETSHSATSPAVIVTVVVIVVILALGVAIYFIVRWRARRTRYDQERQPRVVSIAVDRRHVSAQLTAYGSTSQLVPHFGAYSRSILRFRVLTNLWQSTLRELTCELRRVDPTALGSSRIRVLHLTLQESRKSSPRLQAVPLSRLLRRH
jgi:hypothetical protein